MALSLDVNLSQNFTSAVNSVTTNQFSTTQPDELILVLVGNGDYTTPFTISGGGLTWNLLGASSSNAADNGLIYYAWAHSKLTNAQIILTDGGGNTCQWAVTVLSFIGADSTGSNGAGAIGASNTLTTSSGTGAPSLSLTTTRNNSWVFGVFGYGSNVTLVAGANQTIFTQTADTVNGGHSGTIRQNAVTPAKGTAVAMSLTNTGSQWNGAIVEILPAVWQKSVQIRQAVNRAATY